MQREAKKAKLNQLPVDGIDTSAVKLPRVELVNFVVSKALEVGYVIVRSPPSTGKTSLLDLVRDHVIEGSGQVYRISGIDESNSNELFEELEAELGEPRRNLLRKQTTEDDIWILIDDAQLSFGKAYDSFWSFLMKRLANVKNSGVKVVIAATYDLVSQGSTPVWFGNYPHTPDLRLTESESVTLYNDHIARLYGYGFEQWESFSDSVLRLANGHPGVIIGGINMVIRLYHKMQKRLTQKQALQGLREDFGELNRCFPVRELLSQAQLSAVWSALIQSEGEITGDWTANPVLQGLARAGILREPDGFSCLAAQKQFYKSVYNRPETSPGSLDELIMSSVRSFSALQLRGAKDAEDCLPKEAAFQHLFCEGMTRLLAPQNSVCPELNTFVKNADGTAHSGELDFFINANLKWAVELLRNGDKIGEHVARFDPTNGKYRLVPCSQFIVVDCRGPRGRSGVQAREERCTLYFSEDFTTAVVKMRLQKEVTITLKP